MSDFGEEGTAFVLVHQCPECGDPLRGYRPKGREDVRYVQCFPCNLEGYLPVEKFQTVTLSGRNETG